MRSAEKRSLFEDNVTKDLDERGIEYEYETMTIPYTVEATYKPDIILPNGIIIELKGYFDAAARKKMREVKKQHPEMDIRILFMRNDKVSRGKKNSIRYTEWAERYGFPSAVGISIPEEWVSSNNNKETIDDGEGMGALGDSC